MENNSENKKYICQYCGIKCKTLQKYTQKGNNKIELLTNILSVFNTE